VSRGRQCKAHWFALETEHGKPCGSRSLGHLILHRLMMKCTSAAKSPQLEAPRKVQFDAFRQRHPAGTVWQVYFVSCPPQPRLFLLRGRICTCRALGCGPGHPVLRSMCKRNERCRQQYLTCKTENGWVGILLRGCQSQRPNNSALFREKRRGMTELFLVNISGPLASCAAQSALHRRPPAIIVSPFLFAFEGLSQFRLYNSFTN
jgi:hypothetical protein